MHSTCHSPVCKFIKFQCIECHHWINPIQSVNVINLTCQSVLQEELVNVVISAGEFLFAPLLQCIDVV